MPSIIPYARPSKAAISWPQHLACLWSGHHAINHIPETPFQTIQSLWVNREWPSIIYQRLHSKHSKGTPHWPLPSGLPLMQQEVITFPCHQSYSTHSICTCVGYFITWVHDAYSINRTSGSGALLKPHPKKLVSVRLQTQVSEHWLDAC